MAGYRVQIKGLVRFSYPSVGGFALNDGTGGDATELLYDPQRLSRRFAYFEKLTLRTLARQKNTNFQIGVLVGKDFPDHARVRLEALLADLPQARIITLPPLAHYLATREAFARLPDDPEATHTATFRLDDDDGMHRLTTQRIHRLAQAMLSARDPLSPFVISFNRGFYLEAEKAGMPLTERYEKTPIGIGLTLVAPAHFHDNIFRRNHRKLGEYFDCIGEVDRPMFIRSVHQDNDSWAEPTGREGELTRAEIIRTVRRGFGLTLAELRELGDVKELDVT